jgi:hypothetical protein
MVDLPLRQEMLAAIPHLRAFAISLAGDSTGSILGSIEMVRMMRKGQAKYAHNPQLSLADQSSSSSHKHFMRLWHLSVFSHNLRQNRPPARSTGIENGCYLACQAVQSDIR